MLNYQTIMIGAFPPGLLEENGIHLDMTQEMVMVLVVGT